MTTTIFDLPPPPLQRILLMVTGQFRRFRASTPDIGSVIGVRAQGFHGPPVSRLCWPLGPRIPIGHYSARAQLSTVKARCGPNHALGADVFRSLTIHAGVWGIFPPRWSSIHTHPSTPGPAGVINDTKLLQHWPGTKKAAAWLLHHASIARSALILRFSISPAHPTKSVARAGIFSTCDDRAFALWWWVFFLSFLYFCVSVCGTFDRVWFSVILELKKSIAPQKILPAAKPITV